MPADELYEESLPFPMATVVTIILFFIALLMLALFVIQLVFGPIGDRPAPDWFYLVMFAFMLVITLLVANFRVLDIRIDGQALTVAFGIIKRTVLWGDVEAAFPDESPVLRYGGWGIRLARIGGRWRLTFNVIGARGVVLRLRRGRAREFMFTTKNPEQVMAIINRQAGTSE